MTYTPPNASLVQMSIAPLAVRLASLATMAYAARQLPHSASRHNARMSIPPVPPTRSSDRLKLIRSFLRPCKIEATFIPTNH